MAWKCSASSNADLVANLWSHRLVLTPQVAKAMTAVDRACYIPFRLDPYEDSPQPIGFSATISAPHMQAYALENTFPFIKPNSKILDVGSGSGYLCAVFHEILLQAAGGDKRHPLSKVVGVDHLSQLALLSKGNLQRDGYASLLEQGSIQIECADGRQGWPAEAPFDVIHVGAAAASMPQALVDQLACPGRMFIPVGTTTQQIYEVTKSETGQVTITKLMGVQYIPLCDATVQWTEDDNL
ncbi:protein-l-isoaspartate o-methyltransferase [Phaffia rhodozyma]|uniref:Protein-L-isoaspartate O-methyltransferase n=1 Tax=Phaffia rhodozyma TaxID=264483 RepID=A0A0F7STI0_PHARH|nr:protein-l-isoaspartate o-methyltransferase [Phaffia rhodozyma]